ncbi:hypothetical protein KSS87_022181 [Heliosperma pusillum]|nr:hypothetical protein KSS87_022181 [Heliosperma pusillum]
MSRPAVHPVEAPPLSIDNGGVDGAAPPRLRMKDFQGMPGTHGGLILRLFQSFFAIAALLIMATTSDFPSVTAFRAKYVDVEDEFLADSSLSSYSCSSNIMVL